jgi:hypothetical protein
MCEISYQGDDNPSDVAQLVGITINGSTYNNTTLMWQTLGLVSDLSAALTLSNIGSVGCDVLVVNSNDIINNYGGSESQYAPIGIKFFIFYPSEAIDASIEIVINGSSNQTFNFTKIPTS